MRRWFFLSPLVPVVLVQACISDDPPTSTTRPSDAGVATDSTTPGTDGCPSPSLNDARNCGVGGTCGKDCGAGMCSEGVCGSATVFSTSMIGDGAVAVRPLSLAVAGEALFFATSEGSIYRCDRTRCASTLKAIATTDGNDAGYSSPTEVFVLAANETHVYWAQYYRSKIFRAKHDGSELQVRSAKGSTATLVLEGTTLYWTNYGAGTSSLWRCDVNTCFNPGVEPTFMSDPYVSGTPSSPLDCPSERQNRCWFATGLTVNGADLNLVDWKSPGFATIFSIPKGAVDAGVQPSIHASYPFAYPNSIVALNGSAYFTQGGAKDDAGQQLAGKVSRIQPAQGVVDLAVSEAQPDSIVTDGKSVYWANTGAGEIRRCAIGGCAGKPTTIASGQNVPSSLVVTQDALYWVNTNGTEVSSIVK